VRTLLPHPLRRLIAVVASLLVAAAASAQVPRPIGHLSDYGAVLDRHGRETIDALIEAAWTSRGIEVFILASWENPFDSVSRYAAAVFDAWGLTDRDAALLAVFLRTGGVWQHAVLGTRDLSAEGLPARIESGIADLVVHRRIEEAMVSLFEILDVDSVGSRLQDGSSEEGEGGNLWLVPAVLAIAAFLVVGIRRFVCPRCGRLLRVRTRHRDGAGASGDRVYYCRSCGYRRE
jgi:predicted RNA-binding Zn-ribbon protein involved in translation (DUF1610 family)